MDTEIDEDEQEGVYSVVEFWSEHKTYALAIRIALDKNKAQFKYEDKIEPKGECRFVPEGILKPIKSAR